MPQRLSSEGGNMTHPDPNMTHPEIPSAEHLQNESISALQGSDTRNTDYKLKL